MNQMMKMILIMVNKGSQQSDRVFDKSSTMSVSENEKE